MPYRPKRREDRAAHDAGVLQWESVGQDKDVGRGHDRVLGQTAHAVHRQRRAIRPLKSGRAVVELTFESIELKERRAQIVTPLRALGTPSAGHEAADHPRAFGHTYHARAYCRYSP